MSINANAHTFPSEAMMLEYFQAMEGDGLPFDKRVEKLAKIFIQTEVELKRAELNHKYIRKELIECYERNNPVVVRRVLQNHGRNIDEVLKNA